MDSFCLCTVVDFRIDTEGAPALTSLVEDTTRFDGTGSVLDAISCCLLSFASFTTFKLAIGDPASMALSSTFDLAFKIG